MDLDAIKRTPLSDIDIFRKLNGRINVIMYSDLNKVNNIEDVMVDDSVVILYEKRRKNGHWVCLVRYLKKGVPTIEFFDSYGIFPDDEKKKIRDDFLVSSGQKYNKLAELLLRASDRYRIEFNNYKLQKISPDIATCGRHVIARIMNKHLDIDQFNKFMRSFKGLTPDDVASILSIFV